MNPRLKKKNKWVRFCVFPLVLSGAMLMGQEAQPKGRIINIPAGRGIYYDDPSGLVNLPGTTIFASRHPGVREFLNFGRSKSIVEVPGPRAGLAIHSTKPTFYVNGYPSGTQLYLVRGTEKQDFRQIRMDYSGDFSEWAHFSPKDLADIDVEALAPGLISVTPRFDLPAGEYLIITAPDRQFRMIELCFEFSVRP